MPSEIQQTPYWTPPADWVGQDAFLIGGGSSLRDFQFARLAGRNVIGCNDAVWLGSQIISYGTFGDVGWLTRNVARLGQMELPVVTNATHVAGLNLSWLFRTKRQSEGWAKGDTLAWNHSTGALAINLAGSLGARRIFLLGYDLCNQKGKSHWHEHNRALILDQNFQRFERGFMRLRDNMPAGIQVFNVTDGSSRLKVFPNLSFTDLDGILKHEPDQKDAPPDSGVVEAPDA